MASKRPADNELSGPAAKQPHVAQEEDPRSPLPVGWRQCPRYSVIPELHIVAAKVPLNEERWGHIVSEEDKFSPQSLLAQLQHQNIQVGMIIDLTNSEKYYKIYGDGESEFEYSREQGPIFHRKIHCKGRGEAPEPAAVNEFCWEYTAFMQHQQHLQARSAQEGEEPSPMQYALVHCTHGFNRTGYMIANALVRLKGKTCASAIKYFQQFRPPGIYKRHYLQDLFVYHHEKMPSGFQWPRLPAWKPPHEEEQPHPVPLATSAKAHMEHDDVVGEEVSQAEAEAVQAEIMMGILGPEAGGSELRFPGSQPVSLASSNLNLLTKHKYMVTWKADGTRYMLLLSPVGTYLVDRSFAVRRVQMRWPTAAPRTPLQYNAGQHHCSTLMDGEMVVDEDKVTHKQTRRYLAYDIMLLNGCPLRHAEFQERYKLIEAEVIKPRNAERDAMVKDLMKPAQQRRMRSHYMYQDEPFSTRRKEFWKLYEAQSLLHSFIPTRVLHESDGLILQPCVGPKSEYIPHTCEQVLKWKFAHLNSVDFRLRLATGPSGEQPLLLLLTSAGEQPVEGQKVVFPDGKGPQTHVGNIIECSWDARAQAWSYMRERRDKSTPNAWRVYEKVLQSIKDNISPAVLLEEIAQVMACSDLYAPERAEQEAQQRGKQQVLEQTPHCADATTLTSCKPDRIVGALTSVARQ